MPLIEDTIIAKMRVEKWYQALENSQKATVQSYFLQSGRRDTLRKHFFDGNF